MRNANRQISLTVHGSLKDFISGRKSLTVSFSLNPSVKDLVESKGIPHTAIFNVEANNKEASLSHNVTEGDHIEIFPFEMVDSKSSEAIFAKPSSFIADEHLNKLGGYLRLFGLDTKSRRDDSDEELIRRSNSEKRMIVTRDLDLLKHGSARYGYWVRAADPDLQLEEILDRFDLKDHLSPFTRCMECNGKLEGVNLEQVKDKIPPKVREWCDAFHRCGGCGRVYWKGSHYDKLKKKVEQVLRNL